MYKVLFIAVLLCIAESGFAKKKIDLNSQTKSFYCNWGWGGRSNGWFASYEQPDPNKQPFFDDNEQIYILSSGR